MSTFPFMEMCSGSLSGMSFGGLALLALVLALGYPLYRKYRSRTEFRLGEGKTWRIWHLYFGLAFVGFMLLHSGFRWPNDLLTGLVYVFGWLVALGGGLWFALHIYVPRKLARLKKHVLFERIKEYHQHLLAQGDALVEDASPSFERFQRETWEPLMNIFKFSVSHFFGTPADTFARAVEIQKALLHSEEHKKLTTLHVLYRSKIELEANYSLQLVLKRFHLVHGPLAFVLFALVLVHIASVWIF